MPFPDESGPLAVLDHRPEWAAEFERLAGVLRAALGTQALSIDHVGSTSVPGLAAKDCVDIQVRVAALDENVHTALLAAIGFRRRPEPWNRVEVSGGEECRKLVFAPPVGARRCNVHVREEGRPNSASRCCSGTTCARRRMPAGRGERSSSAWPAASPICPTTGRSRRRPPRC